MAKMTLAENWANSSSSMAKATATFVLSIGVDSQRAAWLDVKCARSAENKSTATGSDGRVPLEDSLLLGFDVIHG